MNTGNQTRIKLSAFAIMLAMLLPIAVSCSGEASQTETTTAADTTAAVEEVTETERLTDAVPEMALDGLEVTIASTRRDWFDGRITEHEQTGDVLTDALYERTKLIEERFDTVLVEKVEENIDSSVKTAVLAGDDAYQICFQSERGALTFAQNDYIYSIEDLKYIDVSMPWWAEDINDQLTINDRLYFASGDMDLTGYDYTMVLLYNLKMIEDFSLDDPADMIYDGKWTYDVFTEMATSVTNDLNGNGEQDFEDRFGFVGEAKQMLPNFGIAADVYTVKKDANDIPYFSMEGDEEYHRVFTRIYEMLWDTGLWWSNYGIDQIKPTFTEGRSLFKDGSISQLAGLREMEDDFGIVPYPKYDEAQDDYHVRVQGGLHVCTVPVTCDQPETIGAIIEASTAESHYIVRPAFYETGLKDKFARDEATIELLDFIMDHRTIDLGDTLWCNQIRDAFLRLNFIANDRDIASAIAANKDSVSKTIEDAVAVFLEN